MKRWWMVACWMVATLAARDFGALTPEEAPPPAPVDRIHDQARLFIRSADRREILAERLRQFRERTGFEVYVACFDAIAGSNLQQECNRLRNAWLSERSGLVFGLDVDNSACAIAWSERSIRSGDRELPVVGPGEVSPREQLLVWEALRSTEAPQRRSIEDAESLVGLLLTSLEKLVIPEAPPEPRLGRMLVLALGLGSGLLLIAMLVAAAVRQADRRASDRLFFPVVPVGERLKAPRGGGKVSSRTFGASS